MSLVLCVSSLLAWLQACPGWCKRCQYPTDTSSYFAVSAIMLDIGYLLSYHSPSSIWPDRVHFCTSPHKEHISANCAPQLACLARSLQVPSPTASSHHPSCPLRQSALSPPPSFPLCRCPLICTHLTKLQYWLACLVPQQRSDVFKSRLSLKTLSICWVTKHTPN